VIIDPPIPTGVLDRFSISPSGLEVYFSDGYQGLSGCPPRPGGYGGSDLWVSTRATQDDPWSEPHNLGVPVNTAYPEAGPSLSRDGLSLYFASSRPGGLGNSDLYVTQRTAIDQPWGEPQNLGSAVNGPMYEYHPLISADGLSLYWAFGGYSTNIRMSRRTTTEDPWGPMIPLDAVNSDRSEYFPTFSEGCSVFYFSRGDNMFTFPNPPELATYDTWQVEVTPIVDFNGDGLVDWEDLAMLLAHWGQYDSSFDIGPAPLGDGVISNADLEVFYGYADSTEVVVPTPALNEVGVAPFVDLRWTRGTLAETYDIYFGTSFDDVHDANRVSPLDILMSQDQTANTYGIEGALSYDQTYYWRVDEVNAATDPIIVKGPVWSFTVMSFDESAAQPINVIAATASSRASTEPERTIDGSGLDADDLHATNVDTMWLSAADGPQPTWIQYEFDGTYPVDALWVWNYNMQFESFLGYGFKDVSVEYSENGIDWTSFGEVAFAQGTSQEDYSCNTIIELGGVMARYVRLTALSNWAGTASQYGLSEVRFFYVPPADEGFTGTEG